MKQGTFRARRIALSAAVVTTIGVAAVQSQGATTYFWNVAPADTTQNWNAGSNWSPNGVPLGAPTNDTVNISNGGTVNVTDAESFNLLSLGNTSGTSGTLNISSTGVLTSTTSDVRIGGNSTSTINCVGILNQSGILQMNGGNFNVGDGSGALGVTPSIGTYNLSGGSLTVQTGTLVVLGNRATGTITQTAGTINVRATGSPGTGAIQLGRNTASVPARGTYDLSGGAAYAANLQFGNAVETSGVSPTNNMNLSGTGLLEVGAISIINTFATNNFNFTGGTLTSTTIGLPLLANTGGTLSPATLSFAGEADPTTILTNAVGTTTINGIYTQNASSKLAVDLSDATTFDKVVVNGAATVNGTVVINLLGGFDPALNSTFDILSSTALTATATAPGTTPSGYTYSVAPSPDNANVLRVTVVPEPASLALLGIAGLAGLRPSRCRETR